MISGGSFSTGSMCRRGRRRSTTAATLEVRRVRRTSYAISKCKESDSNHSKQSAVAACVVLQAGNHRPKPKCQCRCQLTCSCLLTLCHDPFFEAGCVHGYAILAALLLASDVLRETFIQFECGVYPRRGVRESRDIGKEREWMIGIHGGSLQSLSIDEMEWVFV